MSAVIEIEPTVEERAQEDFDPIPWVAMMDNNGNQVGGFRIAPRVNGVYEVVFEIEHNFILAGCFVRFTHLLPASKRYLRSHFDMWPGDTVHLHLYG